MSGGVLLGGPHVQDDDLVGRRTSEQFFAVDLLGVVGPEVGSPGGFNRLLVGLGDLAQQRVQGGLRIPAERGMPGAE
ncbi:hypothetical protein ACWGI9_22880 [Streptomyces sp. NPDC054833]